MSTRSTRNLRGFTLIEILVVVAIIALLVAILLPTLARARDQARSMACLSRLKQVGNAMAYYVTDNRTNYLPPFTYPLYPYYFKNNRTVKLAYDPYWFQYLPWKYLSNTYEIVTCPSDQSAAKYGRTGFQELNGGSPRITFSFAMNDRLPIPKQATYQAMAALNLLIDSTNRYSPTALRYIKVPSSTDYLLETTQHDLMSGDSDRTQFRVDHGMGTRVNLLFTDTHGENRLFTNIWHGVTGTNLSDLSNTTTCPGRFRQLWYSDSKATSQILY
jgi:prepilin-type N-terminal cleavage/methylation domain-containing protein